MKAGGQDVIIGRLSCNGQLAADAYMQDALYNWLRAWLARQWHCSGISLDR